MTDAFVMGLLFGAAIVLWWVSFRLKRVTKQVADEFPTLTERVSLAKPRYTIVVAETVSGLAALVETAQQNDGWVCTGGPFLAEEGVCQAMYKVEWKQEPRV